VKRHAVGGHRSRRRAIAVGLLVTLGALSAGAPALADCIGEEAFNSFTTDVLATNAGAYVMYDSSSAETLKDPLADHGEEEANVLLYSLPGSSAHSRRISLNTHGTFTSSPTLFQDAASIRALVWREGPAKNETAILGAVAGHGLLPVLSPAGSPGFAPLAVTATAGGGYVMLVPAPGDGGPASLQQVNADGSLGASTSIGAAASPDAAATPEFALAQSSDGAIWVAGAGLLGRWMPGGAFSIVTPLPGTYEMSVGLEGSVWALTAAKSGEGTLLTHAGPSGVISQQKIPSQEGASTAGGEVLPMAALATTADGTAIVAYGTFHGAYLESTGASGALGKPRRISKHLVLSIEDLDLQPGTNTPFVSVTSIRASAIYAVGTHVRVTTLPGVGAESDSVRATLGFAPDRKAWIVWTIRRGNACAGSERSRSVWATLGAAGHLSHTHMLGEASLWLLG
jgi:hypothetical protein